MLDGFDEEGAVLQAGAAGASGDVVGRGGDGGDFAVLFADEGDAGIGLGGREGERGGLAGKETQAAEGCLFRNCALSFAGQRYSAHSHMWHGFRARVNDSCDWDLSKFESFLTRAGSPCHRKRHLSISDVGATEREAVLRLKTRFFRIFDNGNRSNEARREVV